VALLCCCSVLVLVAAVCCCETLSVDGQIYRGSSSTGVSLRFRCDLRSVGSLDKYTLRATWKQPCSLRELSSERDLVAMHRRACGRPPRSSGVGCQAGGVDTVRPPRRAQRTVAEHWKNGVRFTAGQLASSRPGRSIG
jgi:hypothetical protein